MEPIRILHVVGKMHRAGLETFIMNMYRNIDRNIIQFDFLTHYQERSDYDDEIESMGGRIYRFSVMDDKDILKYIKDLNIFFEKHKDYDIVHGHWTTLGFLYMFFAKKHKVRRRISHAHGARTSENLKDQVKKILSKSMKYFSNYYFACSEKAALWLYGSSYVEKDKVKIINNAIDSKKFSFNKIIREQYRQSLKIDDKLVVGHIGRFEASKNQSFLLEIFQEILNLNKNAVLLLVGFGEDEIILRNKIKSMGIQRKVLFLGTREDIPELLSAMDVFIFPSRNEALGISAIESQAAGLPTLVSEEIPQEAYITEYIMKCELDDSLRNWAKESINISKMERKNTASKIIKNGYDIKSEAIRLQNIYLKIHEKTKKK